MSIKIRYAVLFYYILFVLIILTGLAILIFGFSYGLYQNRNTIILISVLGSLGFVFLTSVVLLIIIEFSGKANYKLFL